MAAVINTINLQDADGYVCKAAYGGSEYLAVELRSVDQARRFAALLREWADWVEEQAKSPDNLAAWEREE